MTRRREGGFTLIEVTLAIVIGITMVASATLIYNQAKASAGNSRAQAKVIALQTLVEEFAAYQQGIYPADLAQLQDLWARKRPDDWNKSPWGGVLGTAYNPLLAPPAGNGIGVQGGNAAGGGGGTVGKIDAGRGAGDRSACRVNCGSAALTQMGYSTAPDPTLGGGLVYDFDPANLVFEYPLDIMTNSSVRVKGYGVYVCDQQGRFPNFVRGGRAE